MRNYLQHGNRHRPLGTDPITGLVSVGYLWGVHGRPLSIAAATPTRIPWDHFQTTDSAPFSTDTSVGATTGPYNNAAGDTYIYLTSPGAYLVAGACVFESGAYEQSMFIDVPGSQFVLDFGGAAVSPAYTLAFEDILDNTPPSLIAAQYGLYSHRMMYVDPGDYGIVSLNVEHGSGSAKNLMNSTLGLFYFGQDGVLTELY